MSVFFATERLDECFQKCRLEILVDDELGERGERWRFMVVDTQFEPHVDCGVHGAPLWLDTRDDPVLTGVSSY